MISVYKYSYAIDTITTETMAAMATTATWDSISSSNVQYLTR